MPDCEWLRPGRKEVVVLELLGPGHPELTSVAQPILNVVPPGSARP